MAAENKQQRDYGEDTEFTGKPSSFKEVVMSHLTRIAKLSSCELRGGYYSILKGKDGAEREIYIEDTREALSNATFFLAQILYPKYDKKMIEAHATFVKETKTLKDGFLKKTEINEVEVLGEGYYNNKDKKFLEEYKIQKMEKYKVLLTELSKFLGRKRYFEIGGGIF